MITMLALLMMMAEPNPLYVATYIDVQLNSANEGLALIQQYREATSAEKGNSGVDVVQEISRPNHFVIIELWKDQTSFDAHEKAPHTAQFRSRLKAIHNSPYDQRVHQGLAIDSRAWPKSGAARGTVSAVTHVDVPPPSKDATEAWLKRAAEESRKDEGNLRYDVFQQTAPRTNHFTVFEVWKDRNAFDSHETKLHTREFREALSPMLGAPYDERLFMHQ
jgi:quinol monooxygenase YgiN